MTLAWLSHNCLITVREYRFSFSLITQEGILQTLATKPRLWTCCVGIFLALQELHTLSGSQRGSVPTAAWARDLPRAIKEHKREVRRQSFPSLLQTPVGGVQLGFKDNMEKKSMKCEVIYWWKVALLLLAPYLSSVSQTRARKSN